MCWHFTNKVAYKPHFFIRSYWTGVIGYWYHLSVCLSVGLSVRVTLCSCATWRSRSALVVESFAVVFLAWHFLFTSSDTFAYTYKRQRCKPISTLSFRSIFKRYVSCKNVGERSSLTGCALSNHYHLLQFVNFFFFWGGSILQDRKMCGQIWGKVRRWKLQDHIIKWKTGKYRTKHSRSDIGVNEYRYSVQIWLLSRFVYIRHRLQVRSFIIIYNFTLRCITLKYFPQTLILHFLILHFRQPNPYIADHQPQLNRIHFQIQNVNTSYLLSRAS